MSYTAQVKGDFGMSGFPWFKVPSFDIDADPRLLSLSAEEFRILIKLSAYTASRGTDGDTGLRPNQLNLALHSRYAERALKALLREGLVAFSTNDTDLSTNNTLINLWFKEHNSYKQTSTERTRKYRENRKHTSDLISHIKDQCDVTETSPERHGDALDRDIEEDKEKKTTGVVLQKEKRKRKSQYPPEFHVTPEHIALAHQNNWPPPHTELEAFKDYHIAHANVFLDWDRAFYTWLRRAKKFNGGIRHGSVQGNGNQQLTRKGKAMFESLKWAAEQYREDEHITYDA